MLLAMGRITVKIILIRNTQRILILQNSRVRIPDGIPSFCSFILECSDDIDVKDNEFP